MSLDNIQLPPIILQDLYTKSLIDISSDNKADESSSTPGISYLGNNQKRIVVIVNEKETIFLPDEELNFLLGILSACNLNMADIALLNLSANPFLDHKAINAELAAEKILMFGVDPSALELPLQFPHYQVQQFNNQVYLSSPALKILEHDKDEKKKLWNSLKKIFLTG